MAGFWGALFAYVAHLMLGISVIGSTVLLWFALAALLVTTSRVQQVAAPRWGKGLAVCLLVVIAIGFGGNLVYLAADHYAANAMTASSVDGQVRNYRLALRLNPFNELYRLGLGLTYTEATSKWLARRTSDRAAGTDPGPSLVTARTSLQEGVDTLEVARDFDGALQQAARAVGLDPAYPEPLMLAGDVYVKRHDLVKAKAAYEGALRLRPDSLPVQKALDRVKRRSAQDSRRYS